MRTGIPSALGALDEAVPGVTPGDAQGNQFQLIYAIPETSSPAGAATPIAQASGASDNRGLSPAVPFGAFAGVRVKF